ncbi:MAG: DnaJ domain-containing protein [Bdellovibrionota bacterium]
MKFLILIPLVIASAYEYFTRGQCGLALVSGLYMILSIQAEHAANRFLRNGLYPVSAFGGMSSPPPNKPQGWDIPEEPIKVERLGTKKQKTESYSRPEPSSRETPKQEKPKAAPRPEMKTEQKAEQKKKTEPQAAKPKAKAIKPDTSPRFNGKPHEVLVIQENAATITIVRAFRHWVKKYHPDHAHSPAETQSANEHTRMLTDAKEKLLDRRKQMRKPRSA